MELSQCNRICVKQSFCMITVKIFTCIIVSHHVLHHFAQISKYTNKESVNYTFQNLSAKLFIAGMIFAFDIL